MANGGKGSEESGFSEFMITMWPVILQDVACRRLLAHLAFHKIAFNILMNHPRNQGLIWHAFRHGFLLNTLQVMIVQANCYPSILAKGGVVDRVEPALGG